VAFHVFCELFFTGEGVLDDYCKFLGKFVSHDGLAFGKFAHEFEVADFGLCGGAIAEGDGLGAAHHFRLL
jgi:hypothetical protein